MEDEMNFEKNISKPPTILPMFIISITFLKNMQLSSNLGSKWPSHAKKKFENQIIF